MIRPHQALVAVVVVGGGGNSGAGPEKNEPPKLKVRKSKPFMEFLWRAVNVPCSSQ